MHRSIGAADCRYDFDVKGTQGEEMNCGNRRIRQGRVELHVSAMKRLSGALCFSQYNMRANLDAEASTHTQGDPPRI